MEQVCTSGHAKLIDSLVLEDLPPRKLAELHGHLASCPSCQHRYNRVVLASRLLEGGPAALDLPSPRELDWVGQAVLERARLVPDSAPARRSVVRWVLGLAATAAALAIVVPLAVRSRPPGAPREELQARGGPAASATKAEKVGLRAFCIRKEGASPSVAGLVPTTAGAPAACGVKDVLRFAYTNHTRLQHLFLVGLDENHEIKWYEPHPPATTSIKVLNPVVDEPLSRAVRLEVNHARGLLRLFAVFSESPLEAEQIQRAVARVKEARRPVRELEALPLEGTVQRSLLVQLSGQE